MTDLWRERLESTFCDQTFKPEAKSDVQLAVNPWHIIIALKCELYFDYPLDLSHGLTQGGVRVR